MKTRIQRWGNSQGLRLPRSILEDADLAVEDEVSIRVDNGIILISPLRRIRGKYCIENLVAEIPADYKVKETDWGKPEGNEEW